MAELLNNETFVWGVMSIIAFLITQGLKWLCVKPFTKNLNQRTKALINSVILIISFGAVVLCEFLYSHFWLKSAMDLNRALIGWGGASGVYAVFERIIKIIKGEDVQLENPFKTEEGKATTDLVKDVVADGKVDKKDKEIAQDFLDKLNSVK